MRYLKILLILLCLGVPALAATVPNSVITTQVPRAYKAQIVNGTGTNPVTIATAGTNGTKISSILCTDTDTSGYTLTFSIVRSATTYVFVVVQIPASSGNLNGTVPLNVMSSTVLPGLPVDTNNNPYFYLESTDTLQFASTGTVASPKVVSCGTVAEDF